jgi:putative ABC transport system substrate-binding protein
MKRREFITLLGGAAAWPLTARAQQPEPVRRLGVLMGTSDSDPEQRARFAAFRENLEKLGWTVGRNLQIDIRRAVGDAERARVGAAELLNLLPDVILANPVQGLAVLQQATRTVPIVFVSVSEPVAQGFVQSLARPGGNITGFSNLEPTIGAKWLELLKEIAPRVTHVAIMLNPQTTPFNVAFARSAEAAAPKFGVEAAFAPVHEPAEVEAIISRVASQSGGGLIVPTDTFTLYHRELIIELTARYRVPAIFGLRNFALSGGLMSYGADTVDVWRRSATYVDRILRGDKPADLPVQQPVNFELVINLKTANTLGLTVPPPLRAFATEVIE